MVRKWIMVLLMMLMTAPLVQAKEIGGVVLPDTLTAGREKLILNGAGLRKKFFMKIYAGALYLKDNSGDAPAIIRADAPMAIRMHFIYDGVSPDKLIEAWNEGFSAVGNTAPLQERIDRFNSYFTTEAKEGDIYDIIYTPGSGTRLYMKDRLMGTFPGLDFKQALFGIWLGEKPADDDLKEGMLDE